MHDPEHCKNDVSRYVTSLFGLHQTYTQAPRFAVGFSPPAVCVSSLQRKTVKHVLSNPLFYHRIQIKKMLRIKEKLKNLN